MEDLENNWDLSGVKKNHAEYLFWYGPNNELGVRFRKAGTKHRTFWVGDSDIT